MFVTFLFDQQWCMLHYPKRPNGFAVLILGDQQHYVHENSSVWIENTGRAKMIDQLLEAGYTVFYSNLFGKNWGNRQAVDHAYNLYQIIMRKEILNKKIHIFAEGMGALIAAQLILLMENNIRSIVLFSPCISLDDHLQQEKDRKFYYKKLMKEIEIAHNENKVNLNMKETYEKLMQPLCFIQVVDQNLYKDQQSIIHAIIQTRKQHKRQVKNHFILQENREYITRKMIKFLQENERII